MVSKVLRFILLSLCCDLLGCQNGNTVVTASNLTSGTTAVSFGSVSGPSLGGTYYSTATGYSGHITVQTLAPPSTISTSLSPYSFTIRATK